MSALDFPSFIHALTIHSPSPFPHSLALGCSTTSHPSFVLPLQVSRGRLHSSHSAPSRRPHPLGACASRACARSFSFASHTHRSPFHPHPTLPCSFILFFSLLFGLSLPSCMALTPLFTKPNPPRAVLLSGGPALHHLQRHLFLSAPRATARGLSASLTAAPVLLGGSAAHTGQGHTTVEVDSCFRG